MKAKNTRENTGEGATKKEKGMTEGDVKRPSMNWKTPWAGALLIGLSIAHSIWPQRISLDWPSVSLLLAGVLLCFARSSMALLPYVKRFKLGEIEIELNEKLTDLASTVRALEESPQRTMQVHLTARSITDTALESTILELAAKDKSAALVRLGIELEKEMAVLCKDVGIVLHRPTWREAAETLTNKEIIEPPMARALIEFRDIRNQVIHSGLEGPVRESLLDRALDSGLQLLGLLKEKKK
jgi:hypothetical protein